MKSAVYLILLISIAAAKAVLHVDNALKVMKECQKDAKCKSFCIGNKFKYIGDTGDYDLSKITDLTTKYAFVKKCIDDNKDADKCDKANNIDKCFIAEGTALFNTSMETCQKESDLKEVNLNVDNIVEKVKDKIVLCFLRCMMLKFEVIDDNNKFNLDGLDRGLTQQGFNTSDATQLLKSCSQKNTQKDKCEQIGQIGTCFVADGLTRFDVKNYMEIVGIMLK